MFRQNSSRRCTRGRRWWVVASSRMRWPPTPVRSPLPRRRPPTARLPLGRSVAQGAREGEADVPSQATRRGTRPNTTDTANPPRRSRMWLRIRCRNASDGTANTHRSILWPPSRRTNSAATVMGRLTPSQRGLDTCARARQRKRQRAINRDSVRFVPRVLGRTVSLLKEARLFVCSTTELKISIGKQGQHSRPPSLLSLSECGS